MRLLADPEANPLRQPPATQVALLTLDLSLSELAGSPSVHRPASSTA